MVRKIKMLDLSKHPVVDSHCHPYLPENETDSFEQYLTIAFHPIPKEDMENTFIYRQTVRELSRILNFKGTHRQIVNERQRLYKQDPVAYTKLLFEDARIETLLVDTGYPSEELTGTSVSFEDFSKIVPCNLKEVLRIDNVVFSLVKKGLPFKEAVDQFHQQTYDAVKNGVIGLKTIIAYSTGLEIKRWTKEKAQKAYKAIVEKAESGVSVRDIFFNNSDHPKIVMDYFVYLGLEDSVKLKVPFQMHAAMGGVPLLDLRKANPILLYDLINDPSAKNAKIILTHGGYPYVEEAGYIVNTYPNVFLDFSETIPHISIGIKEKLLNLFEMAPTNKIMYGSDGYTTPEQFWISAILTKKALEQILNSLVVSKEIDEEWSQEIADQILSENAKRIFKL